MAGLKEGGKMIGIIGFESLHVMQYLDKYTTVLDAHEIDYEVIYWNRKNNKNPDSRYIPYEKPIDAYVPFQAKVTYFIGYARFLYKIIRNKKYERLIILTSQTAVVLSPLLLTKYRHKYLYDYRDITFEKNHFYRYLIQKLIQNSSGVPISSFGFLEEIGHSDKFFLAHNTQNLEKEMIAKIPAPTIRIVYWGMVRQVNFNKMICDVFGNDKRFTLIYHGEGFYREIEAYCLEKGYRTIHFTGGYDRHDLQQFISETDILLNTYENDHQQKLALTVKLYDGMRYQRLQLVTADSYMAKFLEDYSIAYPLNLNNSQIKEEIIEWYNALTQEQIAEEYQKLRNKMLRDEANFRHLVESFVSRKV